MRFASRAILEIGAARYGWGRRQKTEQGRECERLRSIGLSEVGGFFQFRRVLSERCG